MPGITEQPVVATLAKQLVRLIAAVQLIRAGTADKKVLPRITSNDVVSSSPEDNIIVLSAIQQVITLTSYQYVHTGPSPSCGADARFISELIVSLSSVEKDLTNWSRERLSLFEKVRPNYGMQLDFRTVTSELDSVAETRSNDLEYAILKLSELRSRSRPWQGLGAQRLSQPSMTSWFSEVPRQLQDHSPHPG